MIGKRLYKSDNSSNGVVEGDYWKDSTGIWWAAVPNPKLPEYRPEFVILPVTAILINHKIIEHEDGTITVSPSILVSTIWGPDRIYHEYYHGFLEKGVWRSV